MSPGRPAAPAPERTVDKRLIEALDGVLAGPETRPSAPPAPPPKAVPPPPTKAAEPPALQPLPADQMEMLQRVFAPETLQ
ncbi:MAG: hypothetical protein P8106_08110 [Gammaproteobacteria bacterium]